MNLDNENKVVNIAKHHRWKQIAFQKDIGMISFYKVINKAKGRINVYLTKMTVATAIKHPKMGKTQMFRKKVSLDELYKIFENPRTHTKKGYRSKIDE